MLGGIYQRKKINRLSTAAQELSRAPPESFLDVLEERLRQYLQDRESHNGCGSLQPPDIKYGSGNSARRRIYFCIGDKR